MTITITDPKIEKMAHDLALWIGESIPAIVAKGIEMQFNQLPFKENNLTPDEKIRITEKLIEQLAALPKQGDFPENYNDFLYDENGLPH